jgi:peptidoglycan/xylan/chitin deacetylase (PgdA/CDA1 family)
MKYFRLLFCIGLLLPLLTHGGIKRIETDRKIVALTFDDGPNPPYTENLLKVLADKKVKATFFLIGKQIDLYPETVRQIIVAGHEVGGHSYGWETLAFKRRDYVEGQLGQMERAFENIGVSNHYRCSSRIASRLHWHYS